MPRGFQWICFSFRGLLLYTMFIITWFALVFFVTGFRWHRQHLLGASCHCFSRRLLLCSQSCFFKSALAHLETKYHKPVICNNHVKYYDHLDLCLYSSDIMNDHLLPYFRSAFLFTWTSEVKHFLADKQHAISHVASSYFTNLLQERLCTLSSCLCFVVLLVWYSSLVLLYNTISAYKISLLLMDLPGLLFCAPLCFRLDSDSLNPITSARVHVQGA